MTTSSDKSIETTESEVLAASKRNVEALTKNVQNLVDALDLVAKARAQELAEGEDARRTRYNNAEVSKSVSALLLDNTRPTKSTLPCAWTDDAQRAFVWLRERMPLAQRQAKASKQHADITEWLDWAKRRSTNRRIPRATLIAQIYTELHTTKAYMAALQLVDYRMRNNLAALDFPGLRWCTRLSGNHLLTALRVVALLELPLDFAYEGSEADGQTMIAIVEARDEMPAWLHLWRSHRAKMGLNNGNNGDGGAVRVKDEPLDD
jgi:hypothetical protein